MSPPFAGAGGVADWRIQTAQKVIFSTQLRKTDERVNLNQVNHVLFFQKLLD